MSKYIVVEVPDGWMPTNCYTCPLKGCMVQPEDTLLNFCPLAKAQEVVEVDAVSMQYYGETENGKIHDKDGWAVRVYAAKLEKKI